jgi:deazaflavin-dependent oxidoreductase (nitroreductase family)
MKLPEPFFAVINPTMVRLLRSPLHRLWSDSLMLITFRGRRSGKVFTTPVRFIQNDGVIRCFTSRENQWWKNMRGGADVELRIQGEERRYKATAIDDDPDKTREWLVFYLGQYPQDASYHNIALNRDKSLNEEDLARALQWAVVVEAHPHS